MLATVNGQRWNMSRGCERWWLSTEAGDQRGCGRQRHKRRGTDAYRKRDCCGLMTAPDKLSKRFIDDQNCWIILVNKYIFCLCLLWLEQLRSAQGVMLLNTHRRLMWHFKTAGTINNSHRGGSCTHPTSQWLTCAWISFLFLTFSEQSSVSAWSLMHTGVHYTQSIAPVLLSWNTLLISSLDVDISMGETSMSVIHETTF